VCCSVLQCGVVQCSVSLLIRFRVKSVMQRVAVYYSVLQCIAVCCSVL